MVGFINKITGTHMWVAEERKAEYLAAGHKLVASAKAEPAEEKPVKKTTKKK